MAVLSAGAEPGPRDRKAVKAAIEQALTKDFGSGDRLADAGGFYLNLNDTALESPHISIARAQRVAAQEAMLVLAIRAALARTQFLAGQLPYTPLVRKAVNSYNPTCSGDVF